MRTLSKGNYRAVYDPAKEESMSMIAGKRRKHEYDCRLQEEPGRHVIPNQ